jgi:parallel beta-helix repeat protein
MKWALIGATPLIIAVLALAFMIFQPKQRSTTSGSTSNPAASVASVPENFSSITMREPKDIVIDITQPPYNAVAGPDASPQANGTAFHDAIKFLNTHGGGTIFVPNGVYEIWSHGITYKQSDLNNPRAWEPIGKNTHLVGEDPTLAVLKLHEAPVGWFLVAWGTGWSIENLGFDMGDFYSPLPTDPFTAPRGTFTYPRNAKFAAAINAHGDDWKVTGCRITRIGQFGIIAAGGTNWEISNNTIIKTVPGHNTNQAMYIIGGVSTPTNGLITRNQCIRSGIWVSGNSYVTISQNTVREVGFGTGIGAAKKPEICHHITFTDNTCTDGAGSDNNYTLVSGFEIHAPYSVISRNTCINNDNMGIALLGQYGVITDNICYNNGKGKKPRDKTPDPISASSGIFLGNGSRSEPTWNASFCTVTGNHCYDTRWPDKDKMTQGYGFEEVTGKPPLKNVIVQNNNFDHNKFGRTKYNQTGGMKNETVAAERPGARTYILNGLMQNDMDAAHFRIVNLGTSKLNFTGPNDFAAQPRKWLKSYSSGTHNFTATQPDILASDIQFSFHYWERW